MRRFAALVVALGTASVGAQAAIVQYSLTGTTEEGSVVSGSFSFDTATIGANYSQVNGSVHLLTFSVTFTSLPSTPSTTTFNLSNTSTFFPISTDNAGNLTGFAPGFTANADGYRLDPTDPNSSAIFDSAPFFVDGVTWQYTQVPELSHTALGAGLGLLGFVGLRAWRNRR